MASINPAFVKAALRITDPLETFTGTAFLMPRPNRYRIEERDPPAPASATYGTHGL